MGAVRGEITRQFYGESLLFTLISLVIALGIVVFAYQGITYKTQEDVVDLVAPNLDQLLQDIDGWNVEVQGREVTLETAGATIHAARIATESAGIPLFVEELARHVQVQRLHQVEVRQVLLGDEGDGDVEDVQLVLADQVEQEIFPR